MTVESDVAAELFSISRLKKVRWTAEVRQGLEDDLADLRRADDALADPEDVGNAAAGTDRVTLEAERRAIHERLLERWCLRHHTDLLEDD